MLGRVRRLGSLFAFLWVAQLFACSFRVSRGTLHPNLLLAVPLGVAVAGIAASLPPPWCPRRSGPALALLGPGFASTALLAGLLGRTEAARWIGVSGILGPVLAALWLLWGWRERSPRAQRALRTHTVLLGLLVLSSLIGYGVFAPLRPPAGSPPTPGFSAFGVPFDDLTSVHRVVAGVLGLTSIVSGAWLLLGLPFAVDTSTTDLLKRRPREVPEDALWFEADRPRLHRGWMWFVGLGAGGTAVVALSNLVSGPWIQVPSWPLAILP